MRDGISMMGRNKVFILLALLVAAGAYLRIHGLGKPSLWVDEVNHVLAGRSLSRGEAPVFPSGEPNTRALLYSRLVALSFRVLGEGEAQARLPSTIFGILAIPLTYLLGSSLASRKVGLLAAFLVTFSHFEIGWSRLCRMYTLFQVTFLLGVLAFLLLLWHWKGLQRIAGRKASQIVLFGVGVFSLAVAASVHILTAEIVPIFLAYLAVLIVLDSLEVGRLRLSRWEALLFGGSIVVFLVSLALPDLRSFLAWVFTYKPGWANWSMAVDTHYYYWFLTESKKWPLLSFFVLGTLTTVARADRKGWFWVVAFLLPLFAQTFLFSYRLKNYIFHVYPFFLIGAAVGFVALAEWLAKDMSRVRVWSRLSSRGIRTAAFVLVLAWVPLTVWFRYGIKVSNIGAAGDNGAVNHLNWKGAVEFVRQNLDSGDVVISTLPLTVQYYLGRCDYNLNLANSRSDLDWSDPTRAGKIGFYSGAANVADLEALKRILSGSAGSVWLIADRYRFSKAGYVPKRIADFVRTEFETVWSDPAGTVDVYRWSPGGMNL